MRKSLNSDDNTLSRISADSTRSGTPWLDYINHWTLGDALKPPCVSVTEGQAIGYVKFSLKPG
jgi:hypothetical protein